MHHLRHQFSLPFFPSPYPFLRPFVHSFPSSADGLCPCCSTPTPGSTSHPYLSSLALAPMPGPEPTSCFHSRRDSFQVDDVLQRLGAHVKSTAGAQELFRHYDTNVSGNLEAQEMARLCKHALPGLTTRELQALLLRMRDLDMDCDGLVSEREFVAALMPFLPRASAPGAYVAGQSPPEMSSADVRRGDGQGQGAAGEGTRQGQGLDFFQKLDEHLSRSMESLDSMWSRYDADGRGIGRRELVRLVREMAPDMRLSEGQLRAISCMLDVDGDGRVTKQELLDNFAMMSKMGKKLVVTDEVRGRKREAGDTAVGRRGQRERNDVNEASPVPRWEGGKPAFLVQFYE